MDRRTILKGVIGAAFLIQQGALGASTVEAAEDWPTRNVTVIVPFPPGGQADMAARPIATALEKSLGRPVVVEMACSAMLVRFDIRPDGNGWTIYDRITDQPAVIDGFVSEGLPFDDADDLVDLLNTLDVLKRPTAWN